MIYLLCFFFVKYPRKILLIPATCLLLTACIEKFEPEAAGFKSLLVVEGTITDQDEPYTIKLSQTQPLGANGSIPETSATVFVLNEEDQGFLFSEITPGIYQSDPEEFTGTYGASYRLYVTRAGGARYMSAPVVLKSNPGIERLHYERQVRLTDSGDSLDGIKVLVDAFDATGQTKYYRYEWEETYEINPLYPTCCTFDATQNPQYIFRDPKMKVCYTTQGSAAILLANTLGLAEDRVSSQEMTYVSTTGYRLRGLYSLLVRQYVLSQEGYRYWSELQKSSESLGTLFDPLPYELTGNVKNLEDANEPVLGYFDASAVVEKRLFVGRDDLTELRYPRDPCLGTLIGAGGPEGDLSRLLELGFQIVSPPGWDTPALLAPGTCTDCRRYGTLEKPVFWP